jgi:hypothetical protein
VIQFGKTGCQASREPQGLEYVSAFIVEQGARWGSPIPLGFKAQTI